MGSMRNDDETFRSAPLRLLPFCGERGGDNEHLARCPGAMLALSDMRARLAIKSRRTTGVQSARWSRRPTQSYSRGPARSAAVTRGRHSSNRNLGCTNCSGKLPPPQKLRGSPNGSARSAWATTLQPPSEVCPECGSVNTLVIDLDHSDPSARVTSTFRCSSRPDTCTRHGLQHTSQSWMNAPFTSGST